MSRLAKYPIKLEDSVKCIIKDNSISLTGPLGSLSFNFDPSISISQNDNNICIDRSNDSNFVKAQHGLVFAKVKNMQEGVLRGFKKNLELFGVGFRVQLKGSLLDFSLGYSHPVTFEAPENIKFSVEGNNKIEVSGIDKHLVGQVAANIVQLRKPDSYKGKGVRYAGQVLSLKQGKSIKK